MAAERHGARRVRTDGAPALRWHGGTRLLSALEGALPSEVEPVEISVVLPAHNEVELLSSTVLNIAGGLDERGIDYEIIVVENGSSDDTLQIARLLSAQVLHLRIVELEHA